MINSLRLHITFYLALVCLLTFGQWTDSTQNRRTFFGSDSTDEYIDINADLDELFKNEKSDSFYDSLKNRAGKKNWSRELYNLIIRSSSSENTATVSTNDRSKYFFNYQGKIIRKILIKQLPVFGPTIHDTNRIATHWIERTLNSLHVSTNHRFVENSLFIDEGEPIDAFLLADNERILRNIPSIQDVRIYILPIKNSTETVDVLILTKDVMAFGFAWEIFDVAYGQASVWNTNMLGLGHNLNYTAFYNLNREPKYGYNLTYKINNISNTFTSLELKHTNRRELQTSTVQLSRDFISPAIRFGGGFGTGKVRNLFSLETIDTTIADVVSEYQFYDTWAGYSIPFPKQSNSRIRKGFFITGRSQLYNYFERPEVEEDFLNEFHQRNLILGSVGLTWQGYHTTKLVYGFGDTEDLPYGAMVKFTTGVEKNEFNNRQYYGVTFSYSRYYKRYGYISNMIDIGSFYDNKIEQGAIKYHILHLTPLIGNKRHHFRNFVNLEFTHGINRFDDEFTIIENNNGLRGITDRNLKGNQRIYLNNEFVYYSPQYLLGFRFVYYAFADAAIINHNDIALFKNPLYVSAGIGVRIRNERLVFNTVQLQFNFFPLSPGVTGNQTENISFTSYPQNRMPDFAKRKPEIIEY